MLHQDVFRRSVELKGGFRIFECVGGSWMGKNISKKKIDDSLGTFVFVSMYKSAYFSVRPNLYISAWLG